MRVFVVAKFALPSKLRTGAAERTAASALPASMTEAVALLASAPTKTTKVLLYDRNPFI
jgi:hypothetical protein